MTCPACSPSASPSPDTQQEQQAAKQAAEEAGAENDTPDKEGDKEGLAGRAKFIWMADHWKDYYEVIPVQAGIAAAPMSYAIGGEQHVAILAGFGGTSPRRSRLLVFKLGATGVTLLPMRPPMPPKSAAISFSATTGR